MNLILKYLLLSLCCLILTALPLQAEEGKWIDGIKFRLGAGAQEIRFRTTPNADDTDAMGGSSEGIIKQDYDLEGQQKKNLFPVAIVFPETLMSSFSFRGAFFEYKEKTIASETAPEGEKNATYMRQSATARTRLYDEFFNASDKSFADANSNWALSADTEFMFVYIGYYWGIFLPIGKHHRFFKTAFGLSLVYSEILVRFYLCEEYRISGSESDCIGKKEIDSATATGTYVDPVFFFNLWERYSENSIWQFARASFNISGRPSNLKYKNHENTTFSEQPHTEHIEFFSYTYRF